MTSKKTYTMQAIPRESVSWSWVDLASGLSDDDVKFANSALFRKYGTLTVCGVRVECGAFVAVRFLEE